VDGDSRTGYYLAHMSKAVGKKQAVANDAGNYIQRPFPVGAAAATVAQLVATHQRPRFPLVDGDWEYSPEFISEFVIHIKTAQEIDFKDGDKLSYYFEVLGLGPLVFGKDGQHAAWFYYLASRVCAGVLDGTSGDFEVIPAMMASNVIMDIGAGDEFCGREMPAVLLDCARRYLGSHREALCSNLRILDESDYRSWLGWIKWDVDSFVCACLFMTLRYVCPEKYHDWLRDMIDAGDSVFKIQLAVNLVAFAPYFIEEATDWRSLKRMNLGQAWGGVSHLLHNDAAWGHEYPRLAPAENVRAFRQALTTILDEAAIFDVVDQSARDLPGNDWPEYWLKQYLKLYFP